MFIDIEQHTVGTCDSYHIGKGITESSADSDGASDSKEKVDSEMFILMRK